MRATGKNRPETSEQLPVPEAGDLLVIVHPGSACGSADFNCGSFAAAEAGRQALIREWSNWRGGVIVLDSAMSAELPKYPEFHTALTKIVVRARADGLLAVRVRAEDPIEDRVISAILRQQLRSARGARFFVTGAWHYPGEQGCVGGVCRAIRQLGYRATISSAALTG